LRAVLAAILTVGIIGAWPMTAQATNTAKLAVAFLPDKLGSPVTISMGVELGTNNGSLPSPVVGYDIQLPRELELIGSTLGLAICQPSVLQQVGLSGCPANALVGTGIATAEVPFGPEVVEESASVAALMGPPVGEQVGVLLYAESRAPVFAQLVFPGELTVGSGPESLNTTIPLVPTLPGASDAVLKQMTLEVGPRHLLYTRKVRGKEVKYRPTGISLPSQCPRGGFLFVAYLRFADGTTLRVPDVVPCPPGHSR
jgi:hypothetical protein